MGIGPSSDKTSHAISPPIPTGVPPEANRDRGKTDTVPMSISPVRGNGFPTPQGSPVMIGSPPSVTVEAIPTVFSWRHGGKHVFLAGNFNNWKEKITLNESHG